MAQQHTKIVQKRISTRILKIDTLRQMVIPQKAHSYAKLRSQHEKTTCLLFVHHTVHNIVLLYTILLKSKHAAHDIFDSTQHHSCIISTKRLYNLRMHKKAKLRLFCRNKTPSLFYTILYFFVQHTRHMTTLHHRCILAQKGY